MKGWIASIGVLLLLAVLPQLLGTYYVNLLTKMLILAIFAMSLDLVVGYMDLPSLGHTAFFGVTAYTIGILSRHGLGGFWLTFIVGMAVAGSVAALFGLLTLRTRGPYFFMISLALAEVLHGIAISWRSLTGGDDGIPGISRPSLGFIPWPMGDATHYFYFVLLFFVLVYVLMSILMRSPFGLIVLAVRENELRMSALGYDTWLYKYICLIVSGLLAGMAGALSVYFNGFVSPAELGIGLSAEGLLMVLLGGPGTLLGPVIGAGCVVFLKNFVSAYTARWLLVLGVIYVLVVMFTPQGILGLITELRRKMAIQAWKL